MIRCESTLELLRIVVDTYMHHTEIYNIISSIWCFTVSISSFLAPMMLMTPMMLIELPLNLESFLRTRFHFTFMILNILKTLPFFLQSPASFDMKFLHYSEALCVQSGSNISAMINSVKNVTHQVCRIFYIV